MLRSHDLINFHLSQIEFICDSGLGLSYFILIIYLTLIDIISFLIITFDSNFIDIEKNIYTVIDIELWQFFKGFLALDLIIQMIQQFLGAALWNGEWIFFIICFIIELIFIIHFYFILFFFFSFLSCRSLFH